MFKSENTSKIKAMVKVGNVLKIFWPFQVYVHNRALLSPERTTAQNLKGPHTSAAATGNCQIT